MHVSQAILVVAIRLDVLKIRKKMTKRLTILLFFTISIVSSLFAQSWSVHYTPRFRHLRDIYIANPQQIVVVGGHPFNDSITYIAFTSNAGVDWNFNDIFPGKQMKTVFFKNNNIGICAGDNQALYKTNDAGETWQLSSWGISLGNRNINKLFKGQYGSIYAAGGLDSVNGFLLKSADGGNTWQKVKEWSDNELLSAFSPIHNKILVAGYSGFMQVSDDGGATWVDCAIAEIGFEPEFTSFDFIDENIGFCTGGKRGSDSTSLILKTINGGNNWTIAYNTMGSCLNSISMASSQIIYAVGDYGKVIKSIDAGETWNDEIIEGNPQVDFYCVEFLNSHIGAIAGQWGYVMIFDDGGTNLPEIHTTPPTDIQDESAILHAIINPGFTEAQVYFVYGIDDNFDNEVSAGNFYGGEIQSVGKSVQGLVPNSKYSYYAKIVSVYGEYIGEIKSFYTGNPIPNWDFENWNTIEYQVPDAWNISGNIEKIIDNGNVIVGLKPSPESYNTNNNGSAILNFYNIGFENGVMIIDYIQGGMPIDGKPSVLYARLNYNIEEGDSAIIIAFLKKNNVIILENYYYLKGSSESNFLDLSFNMTYSIDQIPDTIMLGFSNMSPKNEDIFTSNYVEIDSIWFDNDITISNSGFSDWITKSVEYPDNWYCKAQGFVLYNEDIQKTVFKSEDSYHNDYAICIKSYVSGQDTLMGEIRAFNREGFFNVNHRHQKLEFYYKYLPDDIDTARVMVGMYQNGLQIGWGSLEITEVTDFWKKGVVNIVYQNQEAIPDSATISIISTNWENRKLSELCIDKITFDGDYIPVEEVFVDDICWIYPNPFDNYLRIIFNEFCQDDFDVEIYNSAMILVYKINASDISSNQIEIDLSNLTQGVYFVKIFSKDKNKVKIFKAIKI